MPTGCTSDFFIGPKKQNSEESFSYHIVLRLILIGYGVIGQGLSELLIARERELSSSYGLNPRVVGIADQRGALMDPRGINLPKALEAKRKKGSLSLSGSDYHKGMSATELLRSVEGEVVVEMTPTNLRDGQPGLLHIESALRSKMNVITANKGPLALAMPVLLESAKYHGVHLRFSGTVGGGTPILEFGKTCLNPDKITAIQGILNGTTNFILTRMEQDGKSFNESLQLAQELGYAETDPSLDIDGYDTAAKLVITANWLMAKRSTIKDVSITGIREITQKDIQRARKKGNAIRLVGTTEGDHLTVKPIEIAYTDPLCVKEALNGIRLISEFVGEEIVIGKGAGGLETASAILRDMLAIRERLVSG